MKKISLLNFIFCLALFSCTGANDKSAALNECAEGNGEGCRKLGQAYEDEGDITRAKDNFELSCKLANTNGCMRLADILVKEGKTAEAGEKMKYACDRGNTNGCARYAELLTKTK